MAWPGAWRRSAAWRTPAAWSPRPSRGSRTPAWTAPRRILPFRAPEGVPKLSPVEASRRYLEHLQRAWDAKMPEAPFTEQHVLVTVPASFDAVARELTQRAAEEAGYQNVTLLEEPQAAFYAWIERHPDWRERVKVGDLILVVDIGGGTTDFTLIAVTERAGELALDRVAVGEHILLGGDNIDLALARVVAERLAAKGTRIDSLQLQALWSNCRVGQGKAARAGRRTRAKRPSRFSARAPGWWAAPSAPRCAGRYRARAARGLLARACPAPRCRSARAAWACRRSACRTPPMPP